MIQKNTEEFLSLVPLQLPQLLNVARMEQPQLYDDYALLTFNLAEAYSLEEVMNMWEDDIELVILYHHVPSPTVRFGHSACAYSNPNFGQMYKVNAQTNDDGLVDCVKVTVFDSVEQMCGDLCLDLTLHERGGTFLYKRERQQVLVDFI